MARSNEMTSHDKPCTLCGTPRPVLVRCQIDANGVWNFVCPGKCWRSVSGGVEDAIGYEAEHPHYRYGGMVCPMTLSEAQSSQADQIQWKNKHADGPVSAKKPKKVRERQKRREAKRQGQGEQADNDSWGAADATNSGEEGDAVTS